MLNATARARELRDAGATFRFIAATLNLEGHPAKKGGPWHPETVRQLLLPPKPPRRMAPDWSSRPLGVRPEGTPSCPDVLTRARELQAGGASLVAIAAALQAERYPTPRGGRWSNSSVWHLLNRPHPGAAFLVPCSVCGDLTASRYGICTHRPACRLAYNRRSWESRCPEDLREACTSCGQLTASAYGVCGPPLLLECVRARPDRRLGR